MFRLEKYITDRVLRRVRSIRASAAQKPQAVAPISSVRMREAEFTDCAAVSDLKIRHKLKRDSPANWHRLWKTNPAIEHSRHWPIGWVLEGNEGIVGFLGNVPLRCYYRGIELKVASTHGLVVQPEYRAFTGGLVSAYCNQKNIDLLLSTTAGESAGKIFQAFKAQPVPQSDCDTALFWVMDAGNFIAATQRKLHFNGAIATISRHFGSGLLRAEQVLRFRYPRKRAQKYYIHEMLPSAIGDDFDAFWREKQAGSTCLLADRSSGTLRWHFNVPGDMRKPVFLRCDSNGRMVGYAIVLTKTEEGILRKACVADISVEKEDPIIVQELLVAAFQYACRTGHDTFELHGFPRAIRQICAAWNPYTRKYPSCPYLYRVTDQEFQNSLKSENAWYATPLDGDATLMPEFATEETHLSFGSVEPEIVPYEHKI